jgi:two-component system, response regulator
MKERDVDVLLVEDSSDDFEIVSHVLDEGHVKYKHVRDGAEALQYIFSEKSTTDEVHNELGLVLLDINLPKINGFEVLKKIRTDARTHNIPVVMLSSTDDLREVVHAYDLGANSFVVKPMEFEKFVNAVKTIASYWTRLNQKSV